MRETAVESAMTRLNLVYVIAIIALFLVAAASEGSPTAWTAGRRRLSVASSSSLSAFSTHSGVGHDGDNAEEADDDPGGDESSWPRPLPLGPIPHHSDAEGQSCEPHIAIRFEGHEQWLLAQMQKRQLQRPSEADGGRDSRILHSTDLGTSRFDLLTRTWERAVRAVNPEAAPLVTSRSTDSDIGLPNPFREDLADSIIGRIESDREAPLHLTNVSLLIDIVSPGHYFAENVEVSEWLLGSSGGGGITFSTAAKESFDANGFVGTLLPLIRETLVAMPQQVARNATSAQLSMRGLPRTWSTELEVAVIAELGDGAAAAGDKGTTGSPPWTEAVMDAVRRHSMEVPARHPVVQVHEVQTLIERVCHTTLRIRLPFSKDYRPWFDEVVRVTVGHEAFHLPASCRLRRARGELGNAPAPSATFIIKRRLHAALQWSEAMMLPVAGLALVASGVSNCGSGVGTSLGDVHALMLMGFANCVQSDIRLVAAPAKTFFSPFLAFGVEASVLGNIAVSLGMAALHALLTYAVFCSRTVGGPPRTWWQSARCTQFPSLSMLGASMLYPGIAAGTAFMAFDLFVGVPAAESQPYLVSAGDSSLLFGPAPSQGIRIFVIVLGGLATVVVPYLFAIVFRTMVAPLQRFRFQVYGPIFVNVPTLVKIFVLPTGFWRPRSLTASFAACFEPARRTREYWSCFSLIGTAALALLFCFRSSAADASNHHCVFHLAAACFIFVAGAVTYAALFPMRVKLRSYFAATSLAMQTLLILCDAVSANHPLAAVADVKAHLMLVVVLLIGVRSAADVVLAIFDLAVWQPRAREATAGIAQGSGAPESEMSHLLTDAEGKSDVEELLLQPRIRLTENALAQLTYEQDIARDASALAGVLLDGSSRDDATPDDTDANSTSDICAAPDAIGAAKCGRSRGRGGPPTSGRRPTSFRKRISDIVTASQQRSLAPSGPPQVVRVLDHASGRLRLRYISESDEDGARTCPLNPIGSDAAVLNQEVRLVITRSLEQRRALASAPSIKSATSCRRAPVVVADSQSGVSLPSTDDDL